MNKASKRTGFSTVVEMQRRVGLTAPAATPALAALVRDVHRQLDATQMSRRQHRRASKFVSPSILAIIAKIVDAQFDDGGKAPKVKAS